MTEPQVAAIVLHWNQIEDTRRCLDALRVSTRPVALTLVVDNASKAPGAPLLAESHPEAEVLTQAENLGYAGGNNVGIRRAMDRGCDHLLLLNDDIVLAPDCLERLLADAAAHRQAGLLGPKILSIESPDRILTVGGRLDREGDPWLIGMGERDVGQHDHASEVDYVSGSAVLVRRAVVEAVGPLDEDYFAYREDVDWCLRARRAGWASRVVPAARAWHPDPRQRDEVSPGVTYYIARNSLLFARKQQLGRSAFLRIVLRQIRTLASWSLRPRWRGRRAQRDALAEALRDGLSGRGGPWQGRGAQ